MYVNINIDVYVNVDIDRYRYRYSSINEILVEIYMLITSISQVEYRGVFKRVV